MNSPMELKTLRQYGYNSVRCQSYAPSPEYLDVADEVGATANQVVYAWMMQSDPPAIPLMAASTDGQMKRTWALWVSPSARNRWTGWTRRPPNNKIEE